MRNSVHYMPRAQTACPVQLVTLGGWVGGGADTRRQSASGAGGALVAARGPRCALDIRVSERGHPHEASDGQENPPRYGMYPTLAPTVHILGSYMYL